MRVESVKIEDLYASVDWCLKKSFPDDYDKKCLYTACALYSILKAEGIASNIIGGDAVAFSMSVDGRQISLEGFAGSLQGEPSHYWVKTENYLLDPNVSYLPKNSRLTRVPMPMIAWELKYQIPPFVQYVEQIQYSQNAEFRFSIEVAERINAFVDMCIKRYASKATKKKLKDVLLVSPQNLQQLAASGNRWAQGAIRFQSMPSIPRI